MRILTSALAAATLLFASPAIAADSGCGLGSMLFKSNNAKVPQLVAWFINQITFTQTIGITLGTSGCSASGIVKAERAQEAFVDANRESLERDMAQGQGEFLATFADLMGCEAGAHSAFYSHSQSNFEALSSTKAPKAFLGTLKAGMAQDPVLKSTCAHI